MRQYAINLGGGSSTNPINVYVLKSSLPAVGVDGEPAFVLEDRKLYFWNDTKMKWVVTAGEGALIGRVNQSSIGNGVQSLAVVFAEAMLSTEYSLFTTIRNTVDTDPIYLQVVNTIRATTGFTVTFNAPTDSANYVLEWAVAGDATEEYP